MIRCTYTITGSLMVATAISGLLLSGANVLADSDTVVDIINITVPAACTLDSVLDTAHTTTMTNNHREPGIGTTTFTATCNDEAGFSIYAVGYGGDTYGNTDMISDTQGTGNIATGTSQPGANSSWAMKLTPVSGTYAPTILNGYNDYKAVPSTWTKVATFSSVVDATVGSSLQSTYAVYASSTQPAATYTGKVRYTLVHPANSTAPDANGCRPSGTTISTIICMQDISSTNKSSILASMTEGAQYRLKDYRDDKEYYVAKLADGNIWMTQNLDFDIVNGGANINSVNTDVPSNWADAGNLTNTYSTNTTTWADSWSAPESYNPGDLCWNDTIAPNAGGTLSTYAEACSQSGSHYHIGNYYNWTAAVAMADSSSYTTEDTDVNQSICPAGWTLPKSGPNTSSGSFTYLVNQANLTSGASGNIHLAPNYFVYGGYWSGSSGYVGGFGYYWSSVVYYVRNTYVLGFVFNGNLYPAFAQGRSPGYSVRCIAR